MKAHFQRHQTVFTKIECLLWLFLLEIPQMDAPAIFQMADFFQIKARHEGVWRSPLG